MVRYWALLDGCRSYYLYVVAGDDLNDIISEPRRQSGEYVDLGSELWEAKSTVHDDNGPKGRLCDLQHV